MLKDSEEIIKRRRLSLTRNPVAAAAALTATAATVAAAATAATPSIQKADLAAVATATTTPPITPPTPPPMSMMMMAASAGSLIAAGNTTPLSALQSVASLAGTTITSMPQQAANPTTLTPSSIAATLLAAKATTTAPPTSASSAAAAVAMAAAAAAAAAALERSAVAATGLQDHYSLRWNNHQSHILRAFDALLQTKALVDVTLVCAETSIHAHKIVLSACSPFFQRVFAETPCKHPVIVLKDFHDWVVQAIVDFMYRGEISVPQERLQTLIQAGESLQVRGLVESSVPEHAPTPAASPDDFGALLDTSLLTAELERCVNYEDDSPSMVTAGSKIILPSRLFGASARRTERERERERKRERERGRERELERSTEIESDQELQAGLQSDLCTSPMPRRKQARPRRRSGELPLDLNSKPASPAPPIATQEETHQQMQAQQQQLQEQQFQLQEQLHEQLQQQLQQLQQQQLQQLQQHLPPTQQQQQQHEVELEKANADQLEVLKTVIKTEMLERLQDGDLADEGDDDAAAGCMADAAKDAAAIARAEVDEEDSGNDSREQHNESLEEQSVAAAYPPNAGDGVEPRGLHSSGMDEATSLPKRQRLDQSAEEHEELHRQHQHGRHHGGTGPEHMEELIDGAEPRLCDDGPEDLCTTKKDNDTSGHHSATSDTECSPTSNNNNNNNNNSNKVNNNNNRIVLSLKDIRQLNKPSSSANTPNSLHGAMHPFTAASLRDLRLDRAAAAAAANAMENQCKIDALEAQMHAAAAAAAAAAASGENPFQHMEHQMDLSLAAAAAAAAVSHQHSRERDQAMQREQQRELQQQHNAYANSLLGSMGMPGLPPFGHGGPGGAGGGPAAHERLEESMNRLSKEFAPSSPMSLPGHYNPNDGPPHPPSPLPFPGMSSALTLTPPHMFGLDSPLGLFPPGLDPGKLYNPLMEMSDPRGMGPEPPQYLKGKKMPRPKGQHSAPRGGPPRSWTNSELTEALQHVWNKKMTTSQASRIFGIPYNSLLMYVRGKYGKSLKLEQLRKDCISGPPLELLQMGMSGGSTPSSKNKEGRDRDSHKERGGGSNSADMDLGGQQAGGGPGGPGGNGSCPRSASSEPDLLGGPNSLFNPFPPGFYPDFPGGFPGLPLSMLNLLPPGDRHPHAGMHHLGLDEDCKSDRSKQSSMDEDYGAGCPSSSGGMPQPLSLSREEHRRSNDALMGGGGGPSAVVPPQQNGGTQD